MKKLITLCIFVFALLASTQSATAQDSKIKTNEIAYKNTKNLQQKLKFNEETLVKVYEAYQEHASKTNTLETTHEAGTATYTEYKKAIEAKLLKNIKLALGDELYNRYLIITEQEE